MQQGRFSFEKNPDGAELGDQLVRWVGPTGRESSPLTGVRAVTGEFYPLVRHPTEPYFKAEDGGRNCLYGRWMNTSYPDVQFVSTGHIDTVMTASGDEIWTLLALTRAPDTGKYKTLSPEEFGTWIAASLRDAMRERPQSDGPEKPEPPTDRPKKLSPPDKPQPT
jgi:hypothetical protein